MSLKPENVEKYHIVRMDLKRRYLPLESRSIDAVFASFEKTLDSFFINNF